MKILTLNKDSNSSFYFLAGINRPVIPQHVTKLSNSINEMGVLRPVVIAVISFVTGKPLKYIIDGQHLFNALLRNNMDIPYIIINITDQVDLIEKIALLNASSRSWTLLDYIHAWSSVNNVKIYDHNKLILNLKKNKDMFVLATQQENKLSQILKQMLK